MHCIDGIYTMGLELIISSLLLCMADEQPATITAPVCRACAWPLRDVRSTCHICIPVHSAACSMNWVKFVKGACHLDLMLCLREDALREVCATALARGTKPQSVGMSPTRQPDHVA